MIEPLSVTHPHIAKLWSEKNLPLTPDDFTYGSKERVWWSGECGHEWQALICNMTRQIGTGCPYCYGKKVLKGFNDLEALNPELAKQWSEKNFPLKPDMVKYHSNKSVWWKCEKGHEWKTSVNHRLQGTRCPYCLNMRVQSGYNDLASVRPDLAKIWSDKNYPLKPETTLYKYHKKLWWKCDTCGYEYQHYIKSIDRCGSGCPVCQNNKLSSGKNDVGTLYPKISAEWDYEKNNGWEPNMLTPKAKKYIWWKCKLGHSYLMSVRDRVAKGICGCVKCKAEFKVFFPLLLAVFYAKKYGFSVFIDYRYNQKMHYDIFIKEKDLAFELEGFSDNKRKEQKEKEKTSKKYKIKYITIPKSKSEIESINQVREIYIKAGVVIEGDITTDVNLIKEKYHSIREIIYKESEGVEKMDEELLKIVKILLEREMETEAGQKIPSNKKRLAQKPKEGINYPPEIYVNQDVEKRNRDEDFNNSRHDMYADHSNNISEVKGVPIWEKYALSVSEAAQYFHISQRKLREIIHKDKYANYLIWNGGRVFIKRKLFEEYIDSENMV